MALSYTALIRTHNSFPVVGDVVQALRAQTLPPAHILFVDSHSTDSQKESLAAIADEVVNYPDVEFNFSKAINIGVVRCTTPWVLIISSHVVLGDRACIAEAQREMQRCGAAGFYFYRSLKGAWIAERIDEARFDGRNGFMNSCGFLPVAAVATRPFREDVFSAEDQEWAAHYLRGGATVLRVGIDSLQYLNPHMNERKYINEEVSIAYFTCRKRLGVRYLAGWLVRAAVYFAAGRTMRARTYLQIFIEVMRARRRAPVRASRYF